MPTLWQKTKRWLADSVVPRRHPRSEVHPLDRVEQQSPVRDLPQMVGEPPGERRGGNDMVEREVAGPAAGAGAMAPREKSKEGGPMAHPQLPQAKTAQHYRREWLSK